jgi:hypothetical protein
MLTFEPVGKTVRESVGQGDVQFNWGPENEDTLAPESRALALYVNRWGQIVLRQNGGYDDDVWILINIHDVPRLVERLKELAKEVSQ